MADIKDTLKKGSKKFKPVKYRAWESLPTKDKDDSEKQAAAVNSTVEPVLQNESNSSSLVKKVAQIDPNDIINWEFHDRPESELGDIVGLANEFKTIGQQQPCIVRPSSGDSGKYELIIGERRWRAALLANMPLDVINKELSDSQAALAQAVENESREDISEYARGISYSKLIDAGIIKQADLVEKLGRTKQYISALMSYSKIPPVLLDAIGDCSNISATSAEKIKRLSDKGPEYVDALVSIADKLRASKMGPKGIEAAVEIILSSKDLKRDLTKKVITSDGRHVFTWRDDNNKLPSIHFPKQIGHMILSGKIDLDGLSNDIIEVMERKLELLK